MKLTPEQKRRLWSDSGPYSQANLTIQTRILDDSVSRVFLVVEAEINPLSFELIEEHREEFKDDLEILRLLDHAEYQDEQFGYVVSIFSAEYIDGNVMRKAENQLERTKETLIKMHKFVMNLINKV